MKTVTTTESPPAIGPYSQGVVIGNLLFTSGQIPLDPVTGEIVPGGFDAQVRRALKNLDAVLCAAGTSRERVVKVTVFLSDMRRFTAFNEIYSEFFRGHQPARSVVEISALPKGVDLEIEAVAEVE